uniref:Septum-promoting GTP-binding protein 1 n=1 Tax=Aegilops tauschii subsp. strangulata TaxID=200361 RepID=A0A453BDP2_AEGTS
GLKVSLLGDCQIGKTSFMVKYVGDGEEQNGGLQMTGLNLMDKTLAVRGARLAFNIWDVAGDSQSADHVPIACKDAVAILFMFDLTSRCTLNNVTDWYERARKWNKTAIPILIGTKFDDFAQLPLEMQWTIVDEMTGQSIRKSDEGDPLLLERDAQHQREQDLQVHHGQALQPPLDGGAEPHRRRAHHRLLSTN